MRERANLIAVLAFVLALAAIIYFRHGSHFRFTGSLPATAPNSPVLEETVELEQAGPDQEVEAVEPVEAEEGHAEE